ncbi:MAG: glycosyltransferase family 4 protein [Pirellulales bacterium]
MRRKLVVVSHACVLSINRAVYRKLEQLGWEIHVVVPETWNYHGKTQPPEPALGDEILRLLPIVGTSPRTYYFDGLEELLSEIKPDVVLLDVDPISNQTARIGLWCKRTETKLACISCENLPFDLVASTKRGGLKKLPAAVAKRFLCHKAKRVVDLVLCINSAGKRLFESEGFARVEWMPLGFDELIFRPDDEARQRIRKLIGLSELTFAYFGRVTEEKGIHILIQALGRMLDLPWQLVLDEFDPTNSSYLEYLNRLLQETSIKPRTSFIHAKHGEVAQYMNAVDIVVVPSLETPRWIEQYGRVAPEAMACGKVIVASNTGALPELVADCGVLVESGIVEGLEAALRQVGYDRTRMAQLGLKATQRATVHLGLNSQASILDSSFKQLWQNG